LLLSHPLIDAPPSLDPATLFEAFATSQEHPSGRSAEGEPAEKRPCIGAARVAGPLSPSCDPGLRVAPVGEVPAVVTFASICHSERRPLAIAAAGADDFCFSSYPQATKRAVANGPASLPVVMFKDLAVSQSSFCMHVRYCVCGEHCGLFCWSDHSVTRLVFAGCTPSSSTLSLPVCLS
jgi:hypothetical protein